MRRKLVGTISNVVVGTKRTNGSPSVGSMMTDSPHPFTTFPTTRNITSIGRSRQNTNGHRLSLSNDIRVQPFWSLISGKAKEVGRKDHSTDRPNIHMPPRQQQQQTPMNITQPRDCEEEICTLLDCPTDRVFDSSTWVKAEACIQQAIMEQNRDDFNLAFDLLDRMAKDPHAKREMRSETLYLVVDEWLSAYERYQNSPRGTYTQFMYSPASVWRKIEGYLMLGIHVETRTLHRILEATALVRSKKWNAPMLAESILERMITLSRNQSPDIRPSAYTFSAVIAAWEAAAGLSSSKSRTSVSLAGAPERGLALLEQLKGLHEAGWGNDLMPDKNTYRRVMNMFAHRGDGDRVESLLQELYELYQLHGHKSLMPSTQMFFLVLYAWSKSSDPGAAERAEMILDHILELEKDHIFPGLRVTPFCFNVVMLCWSKQRTRTAAEKAQDIFDRMVVLSATDKSKRPVPGSYSALIHTWSFFDPKKAEDTFWIWKREHELGHCEMRVTNKLFSGLIAGWFHSKEPDAAIRCDTLLQYALNGNLGPTWVPSASVFNMTINAYCRRSKLSDMERVEALLEQMKELARKSSEAGSTTTFPGPSASSYVPIIHALTRLGKAEKAEALLRECFDEPTNFHPHVVEKTTTSSNSRSTSTNTNAPQQEKTQNNANSNSTNSSTSKTKDLNTKTFNRVLKAWLSKAPVSSEAADRSEALLLKMSDWGVKPNIASFRYVLECRKKSLQSGGEQQQQQTPGGGSSGSGGNTVADPSSSTTTSPTTTFHNNKVSSSHQILALLDKEYETGTLSGDKSAYLSTRRDFSLMAL